jgi:hypothetical protein
MNPPDNVDVSFTDHTQVPRVAKAIDYLGVVISTNGKQVANLTSRLAKARADFDKMQQFWSHANLSKKFKIRVFKQIFYHMVLYGMHHSWLTKGIQHRLITWHSRALRRILRIKASMISHVTDERIYELADVVPITRHLETLQLRYYGHVVRAGPEDAVHNTCFSAANNTRRLEAKRRVGRPMHKWVPHVENLVSHHFDLPLPPTEPARECAIHSHASQRDAWSHSTRAPTRRRQDL